jgi:hypothetical protein
MSSKIINNEGFSLLTFPQIYPFGQGGINYYTILFIC